MSPIKRPHTMVSIIMSESHLNQGLRVSSRVVCVPSREASYTRPKKRVRSSCLEGPGSEDIRTLADATCRYDLNEDDQAWLLAVNQELREMGERQSPAHTQE